MAAPTQQLPPWLSLSATVVTGANGALSTSETLLNLPLTYYGPSIPLGTDGSWTYGGLTSPASTSVTAGTTTSTPPSSSATPSITSAPSSTSATPTSSLSSSPSSSAIPSSPTTASLPSSTSASFSFTAPSSSPTSQQSSGASTHRRSVLIGAILGSVLGSLFLLLLLLLCLRWNSRRKMRTPLWTGWEIVAPDENDEREPGEGSPRHSGEEADPFLRQSSGASAQPAGENTMREIEPTARLVSGPASSGAMPSIPSIHSNSTVSSYGAVIPRTEAHSDANPRAGHIIPPAELLRMEEELTTPSSASTSHLSALLPPPPLDPDRPSRRSLAPSAFSLPTSDVEADENATFMTARRVRVQDLPSPETVPPPLPSHDGAESSWFGARLNQLNWFKNISGSRPGSRTGSRSRPSSWTGRGLTDQDLEVGYARLGQQNSSSKRRSRLGAELGLNADGERPNSSVSAKSAVSSGNTVYHDARSTPGTPSLAPLPPAHTPQSTLQSRTDRSADVPSEPHSGDVDLLDIPAPSPVEPFASASSASTRERMPFPPGLISIAKPRKWDGSLSSGSRSGSSGNDMLEDEPPRAGDGWRTLAATAAHGGGDRRTTFGTPQFVHPRSPTQSEMGSLHSHLSPTSGTASRRDLSGSLGSDSSRPSGHSQARTGSSSIAHSGSVSSDGRLRGSPNPNVGRASVSAMGYPTLATYMTSPLSGVVTSSGAAGSTIRSTSSDTHSDTNTNTTRTETTLVDPATGAIMHFPSVPWLSGRVADWPEDAWTEMPGEGRWWGPPPHMRLMSDHDMV
ncbi:hypothetical protein PLICRDRAFT_46314 [Plicaturopsis crispa FD-325 SS-3]|uniref:Uncharacterized protein n=1 Tax=Plicaturopsis crispa FD-325 SS-3 TaxID=944288 RepID=A0A0C9SR63_PLICR|nr:hypothetical protein PLICRDRAFT_46314 [Plicaturopsis crispa FD-325 SS-3]